jgi:hypothetical protein
MEEIEVWKDCGESKTRFYEVSNLGRVTKKKKFLKGNLDGRGYLLVRFDNKNARIHHLVAYAFIGERPYMMVIDHIDRCKTNNHMDNLRYCSYSDNNQNKDYYRDDILETDPVERRKARGKKNYEAKKAYLENLNK